MSVGGKNTEKCINRIKGKCTEEERRGRRATGLSGPGTEVAGRTQMGWDGTGTQMDAHKTCKRRDGTGWDGKVGGMVVAG